MACGCSSVPMTGRRVGTAAALTASATTASWNVRLPDGTMHPDGPWRSLITAQSVARRAGGRVV
jgi:hypothetical protein